MANGLSLKDDAEGPSQGQSSLGAKAPYTRSTCKEVRRTRIGLGTVTSRLSSQPLITTSW